MNNGCSTCGKLGVQCYRILKSSTYWSYLNNIEGEGQINLLKDGLSNLEFYVSPRLKYCTACINCIAIEEEKRLLENYNKNYQIIIIKIKNVMFLTTQEIYTNLKKHGII